MNEVSINKHNKSIVIARGDIAFSQFGIADEILDLINEQQEKIERLSNIINKTIEIYENRNSIKYKMKRFMKDKTIGYFMYKKLKGEDE